MLGCLVRMVEKSRIDVDILPDEAAFGRQESKIRSGHVTNNRRVETTCLVCVRAAVYIGILTPLTCFQPLSRQGTWRLDIHPSNSSTAGDERLAPMHLTSAYQIHHPRRLRPDYLSSASN